MKNQADLYQLIHSLTPAEKGYFKKYALLHGSSEKKYLQLFNSINSQAIYNEEKLQKKFKGQLSNFSASKTYLYNLIVDALLLYHKKSDPHLSAANALAVSKLMLQKKLAYQSKEYIKEAYLYAAENEDPLMSLLIFKHEFIWANISKSIESLSQLMTSGYTQASAWLKEAETDIHIYRVVNAIALYRLLYTGPLNADERKLYLADAKLLIQQIEPSDLKPVSKVALQQLQAVVADESGEITKAYQYYLDMYINFENEVSLKRTNPEDYLLSLWNVCTYGITNYIDIKESWIQEIENMGNAKHSVYNQLSIGLAKYFSYNLWMRYNNMTGDFSRSVGFCKKLERAREFTESIANTAYRYKLYYIQAQAYFGAGNLKQALNCLQQITQSNTQIERNLLLATRLFKMIIYYENGEPDGISKMVKPLYKELLHYRITGSYFQLIADRFIRMSRCMPAEVKNEIILLHNDLQKLVGKKEVPYKSPVFEVLFPWLKAKAEGTNYVNAVKRLYSEKKMKHSATPVLQ